MTIQEILEAHAPKVETVGSEMDEFGRVLDWHDEVVCKCGTWPENAIAHRAHVAEVLEKHMQEQEAAEVERLAKVIEDEGEGYARTAVTLTGTDNTRYHAYASARQGIAHQLKFRADQLRKGTTNGR